jgi:hypothetical protein
MIVYPKFYTLSSAPQNGISSVKISTKIWNLHISNSSNTSIHWHFKIATTA